MQILARKGKAKSSIGWLAKTGPKFLKINQASKGRGVVFYAESILGLASIEGQFLKLNQT